MLRAVDDAPADIFGDDEEGSLEEPQEDLPVLLGEIPVIAPVPKAVYADAFAILEQHGHSPGEVRLNPRDFADFRKWEPPPDEEVAVIEGTRCYLWGGVPVIAALDEPVGRVTVLAGDPPVATVYICITR